MFVGVESSNSREFTGTGMGQNEVPKKSQRLVYVYRDGEFIFGPRWAEERNGPYIEWHVSCIEFTWVQGLDLSKHRVHHPKIPSMMVIFSSKLQL